jgi:hypothetical protein
MRKGYLTVKCPRCNSTSEFKINGVKVDYLYCPVCLEGEINCLVDQPETRRVASKLTTEPRQLVTAR